ncbi:hypothetical protein [Natronorubrum daqingense]|uniref:RCK C-terminal domain-containing protein n=1 Tax=Natronorubrum daqingense TaxID=588898 RepID=A0A1N7FQS4_9EURY|nr:hypothetical protein [Natronorubrum daqingense]APX97341.1 hypothetical protein BB347_12350 [Natronorubrum daqingense]SIS02640.1 hypothetical protein SAMN05421809_3408 [Natronorubrum daqingense]
MEQLFTPVEVLTTVSFVLLCSVVFATLNGGLSFVVTQVTAKTVPVLVGGLGTALLAATTGTAAGVLDLQTSPLEGLLGLGFSVLLGVYATSWGRQLALDLPQFAGESVERAQPLSADAIDAVDAMGQVTIRSSGEIREFEGYPPLTPQRRRTLEDGAWRLPADLPLCALESRLEDRLRTRDGLEAVAVTIDGRGRATIRAAPPANGTSKHVPNGYRAVSVRSLLPAGLARGDTVVVETASGSVVGTVLGVTNEAGLGVIDETCGGEAPTRATEPDTATGTTVDRLEKRGHAHPLSSTASESPGFVTVAVPTVDASTLLEASRARIVATPNDTAPAFEAVSLLERAGTSIRQVSITESVKSAVLDDEHERTIAAVHGARAAGTKPAEPASEWVFFPGEDELEDGTDAFLLGPDGNPFGPQRAEHMAPIADRDARQPEVSD